MNLGSQYYRAPLPNSKYWEDDLKKMRDKLNALEKAGYEIVSVIQLHSDSNDFNYEIISKKPPQPEE